MSLRAFHIFFILISSALAVLGGVWILQQHKSPVLAVASFACSASLDVYVVWFIRKSRNLTR